MAYLKLYKEKLQHNYKFLNDLFEENGIDWGIVTKLLCGTEPYLREVINLGTTEIHDSRVSNLKTIKEINSDVQTVYIKPPAKKNIPDVVQYADVSFNTEYSTIREISNEAQKQNKHHKIIIMIEMGDLREGVMGEYLIDFYEHIFNLPNISVVGLGTNLNCLHGVMPSKDKLIQLSLYKQLIEAKFNKQIPWISGGTSVTIQLLFQHQLPKGVNHFRIGETLYFGINLFTEETIDGMYPDVFELYTQIIELTEKPKVPEGELGTNPQGEKMEINPEEYGETSYRAILDIGTLDIDPKYLIPTEEGIEIVGASSDMLVADIGQNEANKKVGDLISFRMKYMGALTIMNSDYINKEIE